MRLQDKNQKGAAITRKRKFQITIDFLMLLLLPVLMAYSLVGEEVHERVGVTMFILFLVHHGLNWKWHKNLFRGRYQAVRIFSTMIDIAIFMLMMALMISGILMNRYVFNFLPDSGGTYLARNVHLIASYWCYLLLSVHLGQHGTMIMGMIRKAVGVKDASVVRTFILRLLAVFLTVYGGTVFVERGFLDYMLLRNEFVFFDFSEPLILFFADYLAIMAMAAILGYYITKILAKLKKR